jgi:hypothetical protein
LIREGIAFVDSDCPMPVCAARNLALVVGHGHGLCSCGSRSPHLPSTAARQRWHAAHKGEVSGATPDTGLMWCPACGKQGLTSAGGRECGSSAEEIERLEPGPWDEWGD